MAERVGFEPTLPFRVNTLSKRAPSATRPSLRRNLGRTIAVQKAIALPRVGSGSHQLGCTSFYGPGAHKRKSAGSKTAGRMGTIEKARSRRQDRKGTIEKARPKRLKIEETRFTTQKTLGQFLRRGHARGVGT